MIAFIVTARSTTNKDFLFSVFELLIGYYMYAYELVPWYIVVIIRL